MKNFKCIQNQRHYVVNKDNEPPCTYHTHSTIFNMWPNRSRLYSHPLSHSVSVLLLLKQMTANSVSWNTSVPFWKSVIGFTGLTSRCRLGCLPWRLRMQNPFHDLLQLLVATCILGLGPFIHLQSTSLQSAFVMIPLSLVILILLPPTYEGYYGAVVTLGPPHNPG